MEGSTRLEKINQLLRQKISEFILKEVELPSDCFATVTRVKTSKDLRSAEVYVSILPLDHQDKIFFILQSNLARIQADLAKYLQMKNTPKLKLVIDDQGKKANKIEKLLDEISQEI